MPKLSVILPVYNGAEYIEKAVKSIHVTNVMWILNSVIPTTPITVYRIA